MTGSKEEIESIVGKYPILSRIVIVSITVILDYLVYIDHYSLPNGRSFFVKQAIIFINFLAIFLILYPSAD